MSGDPAPPVAGGSNADLIRDCRAEAGNHRTGAPVNEYARRLLRKAADAIELADGDVRYTELLLDNLARQRDIAEERAEALQAERDRLRDAITRVLDTFRKDEAAGYRSRDRQFTIEILSLALSPQQQEALAAVPTPEGERT